MVWVSGHMRAGHWVRPHWRGPGRPAGVAVAAVAAAALLLPAVGGPSVLDLFNGSQTTKVTSVVDGDTVRVVSGSSTVRVRIVGIDAPELARNGKPAECGANAAHSALKRLVAGRQATLTPDPTQWDKDVYGRPLRYVSVDGRDVGLVLLQQGTVRELDHGDVPFQRRDAYLEAQRQARKHHLGLWKSCR